MKHFLNSSQVDGKRTRELPQIDVSDSSTHVSLHKMEFGSEANDFCKVGHSGSTKRMVVYSGVIHTVVKSLQKNLPLDSPVIRDASCLSPNIRTNDWTTDAIGRLAFLLSHVIPEREVSVVKAQWRLYQLESIEEHWYKDGRTGKLMGIDCYWSKSFEMPSSTGGKKYDILSKLVKSILSLPNGNVERSLSDNKNSVTPERTNMSQETLMGLRRANVYARSCGGAHNVDTTRKG